MIKRFFELQEKVLDYHKKANTELLKKAYSVAAKAHINQKRATNEPYIIHPLAVASILADSHLDEISISAGLLHDVIEDTQTSYWEDFGGSNKDLNKINTIMNYFKSLTDSLNNQEFIISNYKQTYFDQKITSMHFYHNLIFIYKGNNDEKSNIVVNNQR